MATTTKTKNYFEELNGVNCNDKTEKKNGLTYLSWAYAWSELKKRYPKSFYTIYENDLGWNYHTDNNTAWVKTGVTVVDENGEAIEHIEYLPVMDYRNKSIPVEGITSFDVNKAIQRSLTKAVARHGLGLYIYAGEDLPEESDGTAEEKAKAGKQAKAIKKELEENKDLATDEEKGKFIKRCESLGFEPIAILKRTGWVTGSMTKEQLARTEIIFKEELEAREQEGSEE